MGKIVEKAWACQLRWALITCALALVSADPALAQPHPSLSCSGQPADTIPLPKGKKGVAAAFVLVDYPQANAPLRLYGQTLVKRYGAGAVHDFQRPHTDFKKFKARIEKALREKQAIDIYAFGHGSNSKFEFLKELPLELRKRIRLVYDAGCEDATLGPELIRQGVGAFVGHRGMSVSPLFTPAFVSSWLRGDSVEEAMNLGNEKASQRLSRMGKVVDLAYFSVMGRLPLLQSAYEAAAQVAAEYTQGTVAELYGNAGLSFRSGCWEPAASAGTRQLLSKYLGEVPVIPNRSAAISESRSKFVPEEPLMCKQGDGAQAAAASWIP